MKANDLLLLLLSGPEPQRTIFEKILLDELQNYSGRVILIRGLPGERRLPSVRSGIRIYNHLPSKELNKILWESSCIIGRAGYSSIMDLVTLGKKIIMVPTPGQPEQEYLADYLFNKQIIFTTRQDGFSLRSCLESAGQFSFLPLEDRGAILLKRHIEGLIESIQSRMVYSALG